MAQSNIKLSDIDSDNDTDSNGGGGGSGKLHLHRSDSFLSRIRRRSTSHHLLMDAIEDSEEEKVPLPDYERLSQSMRLPDDVEPTHTESQSQVQKPVAWKLIDKVFKRDGEREKEREKDGGGDSSANKEKKKRSSWLPDPDKRWPIQGWT